MPRLQVAAAVLSIMTLTGCPSEFGKEGRIAKAVRRDAQEHHLYITGCSEAVRKRACARGKEDSDECRRCGGP